MCSSSHHRGTSTPTQCNDAPITPPNRSIGPAYYTLKHEEPINLWTVTPGACTLALIHGFSRRFFDVHRCQHLISLGVYAAMNIWKMNIWKEKSEVSVGVLEVDPDVLDHAAGRLDGAAGDLEAASFPADPDVGRSSSAVSTALSSLSSRTSGAASSLRTTASGLRTTASNFRDTDEEVASSTPTATRGGA